VLVPTTLGTLLRSFSWAHTPGGSTACRGSCWSRQPRAAGAGPGGAPLTIDVDSSIRETYGLAKQGGSRFTYNHVCGYHPLYAVVAGMSDVVHKRLQATRMPLVGRLGVTLPINRPEWPVGGCSGCAATADGQSTRRSRCTPWG
jgi:hypothetical protein